LEHRELVAQDQDLDLLTGVGSSPEHDPAHERGEHQVDQPQRRTGDHAGLSSGAKQQVKGCERSFGHP
jgi:hypothetical protein